MGNFGWGDRVVWKLLEAAQGEGWGSLCPEVLTPGLGEVCLSPPLALLGPWGQGAAGRLARDLAARRILRGQSPLCSPD